MLTATPAGAGPGPTLRSGLDLRLSVDQQLMAELRRDLEGVAERGRPLPDLVKWDRLPLSGPGGDLRPPSRAVTGLLVGAIGVQAARPGQRTEKMPQQMVRAGALAAAAAAAGYTEELLRRLISRGASSGPR